MKRQIISLLLSASLIGGISAGAMTMEQIGDKTIKLHGTGGTAQKSVALDVFTAGTKRADLQTIKDEGGNVLDVWAAHLQTEADSAGEFTFEFDINLPSGKFTAYSGTDGKEFEPYDFVFVSETDFRGIAQTINGMSASELEKIIKNSTDCYKIGISEEEAAAIDIGKLSVVLENVLDEIPFDENDRKTSWLAVDKAYFIEQLNEGKIANIYDVSDEISDLSGSSVKDWYKKSYVSQKTQKNFTERLSKKNFKNIKEYKNALLEAFILATVNYPSGSADVENIMTEFKDDIGITVKSAGKTVWNKLAGNSYASYKELAAAFKNNKSNSSIGSSGGSSSGGSSGGGFGVPTMSIGGTASTPQTSIAKDIFADLAGAEWAKDAIVALAEKNIVSGMGDGNFVPNGNITREQFVKIVVGAFLTEAQGGTADFSDVAHDAWYADVIAKAVGAGVVNGMGDGNFGVGMNITRQDMCVMIYNAAKAAGMTFEVSDELFADDAQIADYAKEAVYALKAAGAISGITETEFGPNGFATRAQAAKIIYALIKD